MNDSADSIGDLERRRRKLLFRAWHRGTREMDLVLGRFANAAVPDLDESEIAQLESLMEVPDPELFAWIAGLAPVPADYDTPLFRQLSTFHREGRGVPAR
jgi:antitoxin CptB